MGVSDLPRVSALIAVFTWCGQPAAAEPVDVELIIAADASSSVDSEEGRFQRSGYAAAFRNPKVVTAIRSGARGRIAVLYFEGSGDEDKRIVAGWTAIDDRASAWAFAEVLGAMPFESGGRTSLSGAIDFAATLFEGNGYEGQRRIIDISANGENNMGRRVDVARDDALAAGITIIGLPVMIDRPGDTEWPPMPEFGWYFEDCVIGGQAAFSLIARGRNAFATAVLGKLVLEIAGIEPWRGRGRPVAVRPVAEHTRTPCDIGEQRWEHLQHYSYPR